MGSFPYSFYATLHNLLSFIHPIRLLPCLFYFFPPQFVSLWNVNVCIMTIATHDSRYDLCVSINMYIIVTCHAQSNEYTCFYIYGQSLIAIHSSSINSNINKNYLWQLKVLCQLNVKTPNVQKSNFFYIALFMMGRFCPFHSSSSVHCKFGDLPPTPRMPNFPPIPYIG